MANRYQNVNAQLKSNYNLDVISAKKNIKSMKEHIYSLIQSTQPKEVEKKEESKLPKIKKERYKTTESRKITSLSSSKQILSLQKYGDITYDFQGEKVKTPRVFMLRNERKKEVEQEYKNTYRKMQEYFNKMKIKTSNKRLRQQYKMGYDLLNSATSIKDQQLQKFDLDTLLKIEKNLKSMESKKEKRSQTTIDIERKQCQSKEIVHEKSQFLSLSPSHKTQEIKYTDLLSLIRRKISSKFQALKRRNLREYVFRQQHDKNDTLMIRNGQDQYMKNLKSFSQGKQIMRVENELLKKRKNSPRQPRKMNFNIIKREQEINKSIRNIFISSNENAISSGQKQANIIQGLVVVMDVKNNKSSGKKIKSSMKAKKRTERTKGERDKQDISLYSPWQFEKSQAEQQEFVANES